MYINTRSSLQLPYQQQPEHLEHVLGQAHTAADSHFVLLAPKKGLLDT